MKSKYISSMLLVCIAFLSASFSGFGQQKSVDLQLDPIIFFIGGAGGEVGYSKDNHRIYATAVSYEAPDFLKEDERFDENRDLILGIGYQYFLKEHLDGLYVGVNLLNTWATFSNPATGNSLESTTLRTSLRVGYHFYPFPKLDLFINPWIGPNLNLNAEDFEIDALAIERAIFNFTGTIHIGYRF